MGNRISDEESLAASLAEMLKIYPDCRDAIDMAVADLVDALEYGDPLERLLDPEVRTKLICFDSKEDEAYAKALRTGLYHNLLLPVENPKDVMNHYAAKKMEMDEPHPC